MRISESRTRGAGSGWWVGMPTLVVLCLATVAGCTSWHMAGPNSLLPPWTDQSSDTGLPVSLGLMITDLTPSAARAAGVKVSWGVLVVQVVSGGPAYQAGLQSGDVVDRINETKVDRLGDFIAALRTAKPGDRLRLRVVRPAGKATISLTAAPPPSALQPEQVSPETPGPPPETPPPPEPILSSPPAGTDTLRVGPVTVQTSFDYVPSGKSFLLEQTIKRYAVQGLVAIEAVSCPQQTDLDVKCLKYKYRLFRLNDYPALHQSLMGLAKALPLRPGPVELVTSYASLEGQAGLEVTLYGQATPGSVITFKYGTSRPWSPTGYASSGAYRTTLKLEKGYDFVYVRIEAPSLEKYIKINIYEPTLEHPSTEEEWRVGK